MSGSIEPGLGRIRPAEARVAEKDGRTNEFTVTVSDMIQPGDIITINQRFF